MNFSKRVFEQFQEDQKEVEESSLLRVGPQDLIGRFKSKSDIYTYFTEILGYYMPSIEGVNKDFLRQVLKGEKKLIKMGEVKLIKVPKYDELSVKIIYKNIKEDLEIIQFLPDMNEDQKPIDREFFFNVINTIHGEYIAHIIKQTQDRRNGLQNNSQKKDYILISDDWLQQLTAHPFISSKTTYSMIYFIEKMEEQYSYLNNLQNTSKLENLNNLFQKQLVQRDLKVLKILDQQQSHLKIFQFLKILQ